MAHFEIELADAIKALRGELQRAIAAGEGEDLRFKVEDLELEFQTVVTKEVEAGGETKGSLKFWLVSGEASTKVGGKLSSTAAFSGMYRLRNSAEPEDSSRRWTYPRARNRKHVQQQSLPVESRTC